MVLFGITSWDLSNKSFKQIIQPRCFKEQNDFSRATVYYFILDCLKRYQVSFNHSGAFRRAFLA